MEPLSYCPSSVDVAAIAQRAIGAMADSAWKQARVLLALESPGGEMWANTDPHLLQQALVNLLHAAVRRTPPGGIVLLRLETQAGALAIQVQCAGESLPPGDSPGAWGSPDEEHSQAGSKPSLVRVQELLQAMGASLVVEHTPGEAIRFSIRLPR